MSNKVLIDIRAQKELESFPNPVRLKFQVLFEIFEKDGKLEEPFSKKLTGSVKLFELRVKHQGQWRVIYSYLDKKVIVILTAFAKKTQKTPIVELEKAKTRLNIAGRIYESI